MKIVSIVIVLGTPEDTTNICKLLESQGELIIEGTTPKPVPVRKSFSFILW